MKTSAPNRPRQADDSLRINRCEQILDAAVKLFAKHGYSDADTQLLANELGVGKGTLYRYFPSKRELFLAAADRVMQRLRERIDGCIQGIVDPLERIATALRTYLAFFGEHPDYVELLMQERAQFKDRNEPTYFQHRKVQRERWRSVYGDLIAQGRIRAMPVDRIMDVLGNALYGTMFTNYFLGNRKPVDEQAQDILDVIFHGILSDAERLRQGEREKGRPGDKETSRQGDRETGRQGDGI